MAFEIIQPDVGSRMLRTFGALSEENRKRQELASNIQLREQRVLQQTLMNDIRERQLGISQQRADTSLALGNANLKLRQQMEERLAQSAATDMALDQQKIDATNSDTETQRAVVGLMNTPDENGLTLSQRLNSDNPQVARDAMNAFAEIQRRYSGSGKLTDKYLNDSFNILGKNRQDELARIREERMAKSAADTSAYRDRTQDERERAARVREGATANKAQATLSSDQTRNRLRALNQEIPSETMQYEKRMAEYNKTKDPARKSQLETEIRILGETIDKKKAERDRLTRIPAAPQPDQLFGGQAELPPVPDNAAAPVSPAPARPSIQAVPNTAPAAAPVAPAPTPADVNGLDFIFARPTR